jgi:hypothetical protein
MKCTCSPVQLRAVGCDCRRDDAAEIGQPISDAEIAAVIARIDDTLHMHDRYVALRAAMAPKPAAPAPVRAAQPAAPANPIGGTLVTKPAPAPRGPRPGGIAVPLPRQLVTDEIVF